MRDMTAIVVSSERIAQGTWELFVALPEAVSPLPGQFAHIECPGLHLRRPISIAGYEPATRTLRLIVQEVGGGTREIVSRQRGEAMKLLLPLGTPFPVAPECRPPGAIWLVAGGIGTAPILFAARYLKAHGVAFDSFVGFRDDALSFGTAELAYHGKSVVTVGGLVTEPLQNALQTARPEAILSCGPRPMLQALQRICAEHKIPGYASLEERMGCGIGACLVCNCKLRTEENESGFAYRRVCRDGPVFNLAEVDFE